MSKVVERLTVTIEIDHNDLDGKVMGGKKDLRAVAKSYWPVIGEALFASPRGRASLHFGSIEAQWENHGLEDVSDSN